MRVLRKKNVLRIFSIFIIVVFLTNMGYPTYALTTGPHQPEYTSYESANANDMVNLLTGDFSLTLPILSVPVGSEGSFPIPLSYHAGIGPEQEASWVGLGWNVNVGAITRNINGFPDDAKGDETQTIQVKDLTGKRGWNANFLGTNIGWDSEIGHYGLINTVPGLVGGMEVSYGSVGNGNAVGLWGASIGDKGFDFDVMKFSITLMSVVMYIATWGAGTVATAAISTGISAATSLAMDMIMPDFSPSASTAGVWEYSKDKDKKLFHTDYWIWLDKSRTEKMFGSLYLNNATTIPITDEPTHTKLRKSINGSTTSSVDKFDSGTEQLNVGAASDINIDLSNADKYEDNVSPTRIAYDKFNVKGPGISGDIKPYRLEIGSVAVVREMSKNHVRLNPLSYLDYGSNKVPFVYEGSMGNSYLHHLGGGTGNNQFYPNNSLGINTTFVAGTNGPTTNNNVLRYDLDDAIFGNERIRADLATKRKVAQGHYVDWLTNTEIKNTTTGFINRDYIDYFEGVARSNFRTDHPFGNRKSYFVNVQDFYEVINFPSNESSNFAIGEKVDINISAYDVNGNQTSVASYSNVNIKDRNNVSITVDLPVNYSGPGIIEVIKKASPKSDHAIGGFAITDPNGMTYHFSIPVFDYDFKTETIDKTDTNKKSIITRGAPIANTWLLTAITGPDYVDRGGVSNLPNGVIDTNDWGYWIKFNYGQHSSDYAWRLPYSTNGSTYTRTSDDQYNVYAGGKKEIYYLNTIETRSHVAMFIKEDRFDSKDASTARKKTLRLGEIALLTRSDYAKLVDPAGAYKLKNSSGEINFLYQYNGSASANENVNGIKMSFIQTYALRRVIFNHNYLLCSGTPNSDALNGRKLTLTGVSVRGRNSVKIFPDYKFDYGNGYSNNPSYHRDKWDGWGMYSRNGDDLLTKHNASVYDEDGWAWSLTKVTNPEGSQVVINYERDSYKSISSQPLPNNKKGGGIRVASLQLVDPNGTSQKTRYVYDVGGSSSGVVSQEPEYIRLSADQYPFYKLLGYPITPVLYSQVSVLTGKLNSDSDYYTKTTYNFITPDESQYIVTATKIKDKQFLSSSNDVGATIRNDFSTLIKHDISDYTKRIGKINSIKVYEKGISGDILFGEEKYIYSELPLNSTNVKTLQGVFSEGTLMFEQFQQVRGVHQPPYTAGLNVFHKGQRTTIVNYPYILKKVISRKDGFTSVKENINWDFITGMVLETKLRNSQGLSIKTVQEPAYTKYSELGTKADNPANRNMLLQIAAAYTYKVDDWGNPLGLIDASAVTWKKDWSYRIPYLSASGDYIDDPDVAAGEKQVWRKNESYAWIGNYAKLQADGSHTFSAYEKFNPSSINTSLWKKVGSTEKFNHNSLSLETKDMNGILSSAKMGYNDQLVLAAASNAGYNEIAYSGAEDNLNATYFGGEVKKKGSIDSDAAVVTSAAHSGVSSLSLALGYGFTYKATGLTSNKLYKASVWTNNVNGRIYYKLNNGAEQLSAAPTVQKKVGNWYLLDVEFSAGPSFSSLEVGVKSTSGTVLFDDFRFQPADAVMNCFVYNPATQLQEYVLDNDNLYTRYQYDDRGMLVKTFQESLKYGSEKLISENKSDFRRFHYDQ